MSIKHFLSLIFLSSVFLTACTQNAQKDQDALSFNLPFIGDAENIVSTRGSDSELFFTLVRLKSPALLETAKRVNGVTQIDSKLNAQIVAEQAQVIKDLQKLSKDIQIVYKYKYTINGLAILGPASVYDQLPQIPGVESFEKEARFDRPKNQLSDDKNIMSLKTEDLKAHNSVKFIGAEDLNKAGVTGHGMRVGVIDTGIDYTHSMLGGVGTEAAYKAIDPSKPNSAFPNSKVVGGIDLVGTNYGSTRIPKLDMNPLDEAGHGTHVAGTIAGVGDGVSSYDGVAPDASLYAIKVFGAKGGTSDTVVIAALEFAVDPNGDGILDDQMDVVNLSLGSSYGTPKSLYDRAIKNLVRGGTNAVVSAGNADHNDYIVGSPGTVTEALTVAASIDDTNHNWQFNSSLIKIGNEDIFVDIFEAATTKPVADSPVVGEFYYIGKADADLTPAQNAALKGKVALIDRGAVSFNDKIKRAALGGAIGVVVVNNAPGSAAGMLTTDKFDIPAIMVSLDVGNKIKAAMNATPIVATHVEFLTDHLIEKPEMIDTITSFSSKGPRSIDGFLKPEISAPGYSVISAGMGTGNQPVQMSGTSMAAPHMTGVMALLKQGLKNKGINLTALELKNVAMANAKTMSEKGQAYPVTLQGAGRVQADLKMINTPIVADQPSLAFGEVSVASKKVYTKAILFKNISGVDSKYSYVFEGHPGVKLLSAKDSHVGKNHNVILTLQLDASVAKKSIEEFDGFLKVLDNGAEIYRLPLLAVVHKISDISVTAQSVAAQNKVNLSIQNKSPNEGEALLFNLLATDDRKVAKTSEKDVADTDCDLQSTGYRIVTHKNGNGVDTQFIQFAVKTYKLMTTWDRCDISILIDSNKDGKVDQELVATDLKSIPGQDNLPTSQFLSILIDTPTAQQITTDFETAVKAAGNDPVKIKALKPLDYTPSLQDGQELKIYSGSSIAVLEADLSLIAKDANNNISFQVLTSYYSGESVEFDDYLKKNTNAKNLFTISSAEQDQPFYGFSENASNATLSPISQKVHVLNRGKAQGDLIGYFPQNDMSFSNTVADKQSLVIKVK